MARLSLTRRHRSSSRIEGVTDAETAAQVWEAHRQRGSVVVDNFHGLLRSKLQCPDCGATSVKFDPYITLGLPIPSAPAKRRKVFVARLPEGACVRACTRLPSSPLM